MAFVKTEVQGAVEIITIDRPKALNALNPEVLADLKAAFEAVDQENVRCIVLTGEGDKSFVAGADIGSMSTMTKAEGEAFGKLGNDVFLMIESFPIPVVHSLRSCRPASARSPSVQPEDTQHSPDQCAEPRPP